MPIFCRNSDFQEMKISAFIFSLLFIVLTVQPMFISWSNMALLHNLFACDNFSNTACCHKAGAEKKLPVKKPVKHSGNSCENCNPFMACNTCAYLPEQIQKLSSPFIMQFTDATNALNNCTLSDYNAESWHPPELFYQL